MLMGSMIILLCTSFYTGVQADAAAERISQIRNQQWCAASDVYMAYEHEIQHLRSQADGQPDMSRWDVAVAYLHAVPWIVWQVMLILVAILLGIYLPYVWSGRYILLTILLVILTGMIAAIVGYGVYEQTRSIVVVHCQEAPVRVGPATTYPIHTTLKHLDEAEIQERLEDWIKVRYPNGYGWIQQSDVTYVS